MNATVSQNKILEFYYIAPNKEKFSLNGNPIAGFPSFMANGKIICQFWDFYLSLAAKYVGIYKTDNFGDMPQNDSALRKSLSDYYYYDNNIEPYMVFNLNFSYQIIELPYLWNLKLFCQINNLFNERFATGAEGKEFFPAAERNIFIGTEILF